jgi:prepilin-type N-terminal cleavage/methylation domain-containing protein
MRVTRKSDSGNERPVAVDWHDCVWSPLIMVGGPAVATPRHLGIKALPILPSIMHSSRHHSIDFKFMKAITLKCGPPAAPKRSEGGRRPAAFTIVELLTVIAIISILAALLLPVLSKAKDAGRKAQAKTEISQIVSGIQQYDSVYGRFPVSTEDQQQVGPANDFTCGGAGYDISGATLLWTMGITNNAEVIAILMDATNYPGGGMTPNRDHVKNPQRTIFLNAKVVADNNSPGVGQDGVYRDPWGNPYIITMDLNYDEQCHDSNYCQQAVSQSPPMSASPYVQTGFNGLFNPNANPVTQADKDNYLYHGKVMVWSSGPDRQMTNAVPANLEVNKDNILSWQ